MLLTGVEAEDVVAVEAGAMAGSGLMGLRLTDMEPVFDWRRIPEGEGGGGGGGRGGEVDKMRSPFAGECVRLSVWFPFKSWFDFVSGVMATRLFVRTFRRSLPSEGLNTRLMTATRVTYRCLVRSIQSQEDEENYTNVHW